MSLALYRTYRPGRLSDVIGQEHVTVPLARAIDTGRAHHAYLFTGPRGCGKTSTARILARSLNCEQWSGTCDTLHAHTQVLGKLAAVLAPPEPADVEVWVQQSEDQHPGLAQLKVALDVAKLETAKAEAGHKPTLDLTGSYTVANSQKGSSSAPTATW